MNPTGLGIAKTSLTPRSDLRYSGVWHAREGLARVAGTPEFTEAVDSDRGGAAAAPAPGRVSTGDPGSEVPSWMPGGGSRMKRGVYTAGAVVIAAMLAWAAWAQAPAPTPGTWVKLAAFPEPAEELYGATAGGKLYVFGGLAPGWQPRGLVYEYDPGADRWTKKKPMALPSHHVAFETLNGKIYAFGGRLGAAFISVASNTDVVEEYDPATDQWGAVKARMPVPRHGLAAAVIGNRLHLVSGDVQSSGIPNVNVHSDSHDVFEIPDR